MSVCRSTGLLVSRSVGRLTRVCWSVSLSVCRLVGSSVCRHVRQLRRHVPVGQSVWLYFWSAAWSVFCSVGLHISLVSNADVCQTINRSICLCSFFVRTVCCSLFYGSVILVCARISVGGSVYGRFGLKCQKRGSLFFEKYTY